MGKSQKTIKEFALIGFILLAVLFGFTIMTFIFGNLGSADYLTDVTQTAVNETGVHINATGHQLEMPTQANFSGGTVIVEVYNMTTTFVIPSANYTVNARTGIITNASISESSNYSYGLNVTYTSKHKTETEMVSDEVTNQSLRAIGKYADQSGTQFTTLGVVITLILLVAVFLFFWRSFMGKEKGKEGPGSF